MAAAIYTLCALTAALWGSNYSRRFASPRRVNGSATSARGAERKTQSHLLRCVIGNPFRPVTFFPEWRTSTVLALTAQMYAERDFGALPILADALQDAGCDSADILNHCRNSGPHVRGCWVVDLVLGKE